MGSLDGDVMGASPSQAIVEAVAEQEGIDVTEVEPPAYEPLYTVVDPEALDGLFAPTSDGRERPPGRVELVYAGYDVTVYADGRVDLEPRPDADGRSNRSVDADESASP